MCFGSLKGDEPEDLATQPTKTSKSPAHDNMIPLSARKLKQKKEKPQERQGWEPRVRNDAGKPGAPLTNTEALPTFGMAMGAHHGAA